MSGILKRLYLVVAKGPWHTGVFGPYTARSTAENVQNKKMGDRGLIDVMIDEMPVNPEEPIDIIGWLDEKYPQRRRN